MIDIAEHDDTAEDGVPGGLPEDERILWQGKPDWRRLATRALHLRKVAVYFLVLLLARQLLLLRDGAPLAEVSGSALQTAVLGGAAIGLLALLAWLLARASVYTLTSRRLIMSFGVALPVSLNVPFSRLDAADLKEFADGSGDIVLRPRAGERLSFIVLWPHVKPFSFGRAQPMLRAITSVADVAGLLADAIAAEARRRPRPAPPAADAVAADGSTEMPRRRSRFASLLEYPTGPLAAGTALVAVSILSVAWFRLSGAGDAPAGTDEPVVAELRLNFEDRADGAVLVTDADTQAVIDTLAPGSNGFVRSTLRGLARARRAQNAGNDTPFALVRLASGRVLLSDPVTGREVDLYAFGHTNARALARFLDAAAGSPSSAARPTGTLTSEATAAEPLASTMTPRSDVVVAGSTIEETRQ